MRSRRSGISVVVAAVLALFALAACGGSTVNSTSGSTSSATASGTASGATGGSGAAGKALTVGGANFTEMMIMQQMYGQLLHKAGNTVAYKTADSREIYAPALEAGQIDVVPEYAATMAEYLNKAINGPNAKAISSNDAAATVAAMRPLAAKKGLTVLEPTQAADQNGFAVTKAFSEKNKVTTLSQLAALNKPIVLAAVEECATRPFCQPGLAQTYGLKISKVLPLGFGSPQAKQAVTDGKADLVLVGTTDGTLDQLGLVLLQDDKHLQAADNLVPVVNTASAGTPEIAKALDALVPVLTTADLAKLNQEVDGQRQKPEDVARQYLQSKGLL